MSKGDIYCSSKDGSNHYLLQIGNAIDGLVPFAFIKEYLSTSTVQDVPGCDSSKASFFVRKGAISSIQQDVYIFLGNIELLDEAYVLEIMVRPIHTFSDVIMQKIIECANAKQLIALNKLRYINS